MQADETLGLENEGALLRGALVRYNKGAPSIQRLFTLAIEAGEKEIPLSKTLLKRVLIVTGLAPEDTLVRPLEVKLTKQSDVDTVLPFQAEPLLPYPINQAYIDRWVLGKTADSTQMSLLAVRKEVLQNHLKWYEETLHVDPERVSTDSAALSLFAHWYAPTSGLLLILHLGRDNAVFLLAEEGKVLAAQSLPPSLTPLWCHPVKEVPTKEGTAPYPPTNHSQNSLETLRQTLTRLLFAFNKHVKGRDILKVLYTGEGAIGVKNSTLLSTLTDWLGKERIELITPIKPRNYDNHDLLTYAIPIGLACGAFPDARNTDPIQLRQGEDAYKHPFKRLKIPLILFTAAALLCAFSLYLWNATAIQTRLTSLQAQYGTLLTQMNRNHEEIEAQVSGKGSSETPVNCLALSRLSPLAINRRLAFLEKEQTHIPDTFPLQPNILRVSDLLAYLSIHPKATQIDPTTGAKTPLFQINSINYQMIKRPDRNKPTEHYQVKVDLELQSNDSKGPRELYDALMQPNEVVDAGNAVTWAAGQGKYRISFYLKDHTVYP